MNNNGFSRLLALRQEGQVYSTCDQRPRTPSGVQVSVPTKAVKNHSDIAPLTGRDRDAATSYTASTPDGVAESGFVERTNFRPPGLKLNSFSSPDALTGRN